MSTFEVSLTDIKYAVMQPSADVENQILALCDEFVPADPPEYFFDRFNNVLFYLLHIINLVLFTVDIRFDQTISDAR